MKYREWQYSLREKVIFQLRDNKIVLLQAPTGSGKTFFALDVAFSIGDKVLVAVRTHNEFYPFYREMKNHFPEKRYAFLIGKTNSCLIAGEKVSAEDITCMGCNYLSWKDVEFDGPPFEVLAKLKTQGLKEGFCPYHSIINSIDEADLILVTYPYLFVPSLRDSLGISLRDYTIIVDEAHNLDNLPDLEERKLSSQNLNLAIKQSRNDEVKKILEWLKSRVADIAYDDRKYISVKKDVVISLLDKDQLSLIESESSVISQRMISSKKITTNYLLSIVKFFEALKDSRVRVFSSNKSLVSKRISSMDYLDIFNEEGIKGILMSGTLQGKEYFSSVLGLRRESVYLDVEREVGRIGGEYQCLIALDVTSSYAMRGEEMSKRFASYLLRIYYQSPRHVLAVFPSYEMIEKVSSFIRSANLFIESSNTKIDDLIEHVKNTPKVMIMAAARGKLSEGIELSEKGRSMISDVAIVGVPYPPLDDYMKARADEVSKLTKKNYLEELMQMPAYISVRQAIGRSIRSSEDRSTIWLLDKRFNTLWWKKNIKCFNPKLIRL